MQHLGYSASSRVRPFIVLAMARKGLKQKESIHTVLLSCSFQSSNKSQSDCHAWHPTLRSQPFITWPITLGTAKISEQDPSPVLYPCRVMLKTKHLCLWHWCYINDFSPCKTMFCNNSKWGGGRNSPLCWGSPSFIFRSEAWHTPQGLMIMKNVLLKKSFM